MIASVDIRSYTANETCTIIISIELIVTKIITYSYVYTLTVSHSLNLNTQAQLDMQPCNI